MFSNFSLENVQQIVNIQEKISYQRFQDTCSEIEELTKNINNIINREQIRLFCLFNLYSIKKSRDGVFNPKTLPNQIMDFHRRLFPDIKNLLHSQIEERWEQFGSQSFINVLKAISHGDPDLDLVIHFIESKPTGKDFLNFINKNKDKKKDVLELNPVFLQFIPQVQSSYNTLITDDEYNAIVK